MTQAEKILLELGSGDWVPTRKLVEIAFQYNARIKDLRDKGHEIVNKRDPDNPRITFFKLIPEEQTKLDL